jgi:hypothetical protein
MGLGTPLGMERTNASRRSPGDGGRQRGFSVPCGGTEGRTHRRRSKRSRSGLGQLQRSLMMNAAAERLMGLLPSFVAGKEGRSPPLPLGGGSKQCINPVPCG